MAEEKVSLRLLVDTENNTVLYALAEKDFMDALFNFLTLPLGTIARIVNRDPNSTAVRVGSLNSLYLSVAKLEEKYFLTKTCKEMLLYPRNSMEFHQNSKLNIDDTERIKYFICGRSDCFRKESGGLLSTFKNKRCNCGKLMDQEISLGSLLSREKNKGYVNELAVFNVSDDLKVNSNILGSTIVGFWNNLEIDNMDSTEEIPVIVDTTKMVDLLKFALTSKTPLTNLFLREKEVQNDFDVESLLPLEILPTENIKCMKVRVVLQKSKSKVLFACVEEDFAEFLLSFLTLPLGAVLNLLQGKSGLNCLDNMFESLFNLDVNRNLRSEEIKEMLMKPQIASQFKFQNKILPMDEATTPNYFRYTFMSEGSTFRDCLTNSPHNGLWDEKCAPLSVLDAKISCPSGSLKEASYMVTDDLILTSFSSIFAASLLKKSNIHFLDLEEKVINVGLKEGLTILRASLVSSSALTLGLRPFIKRAI